MHGFCAGLIVKVGVAHGPTLISAGLRGGLRLWSVATRRCPRRRRGAPGASWWRSSARSRWPTSSSPGRSGSTPAARGQSVLKYNLSHYIRIFSIGSFCSASSPRARAGRPRRRARARERRPARRRPPRRARAVGRWRGLDPPSEKDAKLAHKLVQLLSFQRLYSHRNAWATLRILGQTNTFLAPVLLELRRRERAGCV